jgi:hypothetical protein
MIITHGNKEQQHPTTQSQQRAIATHGNNKQQWESPRVATTHSNDEKEQSSINQNIMKQMKTLNTKITMRIVFTQLYSHPIADNRPTLV